MAYLDGVFFRAVSNGTGDFVVDTAIQGYQTPATAGAVNAGVYGYRAESDDLTQWEYGTTTYTSSGTSCSRTVLGNSAGTTAKINFTLAPKVGFVELSIQLADASNLQNGQFEFHNRLINPNGLIWQRANSGAAAITDATYAFDRWYGLTQTAGATASQGANFTNGVPYYMLLTQPNATSQRIGLAQVIESVNCIDLRGQTVTLSGLTAVSSLATTRFAIIEWTGTADAVTKDVVNDWTNGTFTAGNFFKSTSFTIAAVGSKTGGLSPFSLTATISSAANNIIVLVWSDAVLAQNAVLYLGKAQLEIGSSPTQFAVRSIVQERELCLAYYETTYLSGVAPGSASSFGRIAALYGTMNFQSNNRFGVRYTVPKRASPTITTYNVVTGSSGVVGDNLNNNVSATAVNISNLGFEVQLNANANGGIFFHYLADAEL